jgi:hypothetical protein
LVWSVAIVDAPAVCAAFARVYSGQSRLLDRLAGAGFTVEIGCNDDNTEVDAEHTVHLDQRGIVDIAPFTVYQVDLVDVNKITNVLCLCQQEAAPPPGTERREVRRVEY